MIQFIFEIVASLLGGYFSQTAVEKKIRPFKFCCLIFVLMLMVCFSIELSCYLRSDCAEYKFYDFMFSLGLSFLTALMCYLVYLFHRKVTKRQETSNHD